MEHLEIELPEKYKNIIKDVTIELVDGKIIISTKKQEFKDGDILFSNNSDCGNIFCIYKKDNEIETAYYCSLSEQYGLEINNDYWGRKIIFRLATEEEKQELFNALEKRGKRWNLETKQIEDILKVGDICILWDYNKNKSIVSTIDEIDLLHPKPYVSNRGRFYNAIKCTSLEQYINFKK